MNPLVYLASPYTHQRYDKRHERAHAVSAVAAQLLAKGWPVYCPIAHGHAIATSVNGALYQALADDAELWDRASDRFLALSSAVIVATIPGWRESRGVERELAHATRADLVVRYLEPGQAARVAHYSDPGALHAPPLLSTPANG